MGAATLTLYVDAQYLSPYAMSAYVALLEKGLSFRTELVDLDANAQLEEPYRSRSLTGRVPALQHGDLSLSESSAIAEYLEEAFPAPKYPPLYPADPVARARARQVQAWLRSDLLPLREERPTTVVFVRPTQDPLSEKGRAAAAKLFAAAEALFHSGQNTIAESWCIADSDLALMLNRLVLNGDAVPSRLQQYAKHQWERPSIQRWINAGRSRR